MQNEGSYNYMHARNALPDRYALYLHELTNLICEFWDLIPFRIAEIWVKDNLKEPGW